MDIFSPISSVVDILLRVCTFLNRRKKITVELFTNGRFSEEPIVHIKIQNDSKLQITIVRILIRQKKRSEIVELSSQGFDLPKTLLPDQHIKLEAPYLAHNIEKVMEVYAEDSSGKMWKVRKNSLKKSAKILRNYIGKRLVYPSMGDQLDEKKIK